ncbi:Uma2 family endonuclease [Streptacidiphilus anmyonensis]|uniref:Uma2 family endonuclease n=1 Tax=Streptacidiphilus anmyonensis TaxID=405782 RepID=UPI000B034743
MALMTAAERPAVTSDSDGLLEAFLDLSVPDGFRAQLIEGEIIVTPPPDGAHETLISVVAKQLYRHAGLDVDVLQTKGLRVPGGRFIPDATVIAAGGFMEAEPWAEPAGVLLVLEVTSSRPDKDREAKRLGYAKAGIPCYLLVDRSEGKITLFTDPEKGDYQTATRASFGKPLDLPAPFGFTIDTTPFT